jgi:hypothetical protein
MNIQRFDDGWHITFINFLNKKEETYVHPLEIESLLDGSTLVITEEMMNEIFKNDETATTIVFNIKKHESSIAPSFNPPGNIPITVISNE